MPPLRRVLGLTLGERRLLLRAFLLAVVRLGPGRLPFELLSRLVVGHPSSGRSRPSPDPALAGRVAWAVRAAADRVPGSARVGGSPPAVAQFGRLAAFE
jgi:hypothetical protein